MKYTRTITILSKRDEQVISSEAFGEQMLVNEREVQFIKNVQENGAKQYWCRIVRKWEGSNKEELERYIDLTWKPSIGNDLYKQFRGMGFELRTKYEFSGDDSVHNYFD